MKMLPRTFIAAAYFDATTRRIVREPIAVRVLDGRIDAVDTGSSSETVIGDVVELHRDSVMLPGFIDAHVHLTFVPRAGHEETIRATVEANPSARRSTILGNAARALRGGVTTVRDCGDLAHSTGGIPWDRLVSDASAPRVLRSGPPLTTPQGHLYWCGGVLQNDEDLSALVQSYRGTGATWLKVMVSGGQMTAGSDPFASQFSAARVSEISREAHAAGLRVAGHALNSDSIAQAVAAGLDTVEHGLWRDASAQPDFRPDVAESLAAAGSSVIWTFGGIARLGLGLPGYEQLAPPGELPDPERFVNEMEAMLAPGPLRMSGTQVAVASDAGVRGTEFDTFVDALMAASLVGGFGAGETAALGTIDAARALGLQNTLGSIEVGKHADLQECRVHERQGAVRFEVGRVWLGGHDVPAAELK